MPDRPIETRNIARQPGVYPTMQLSTNTVGGVGPGRPPNPLPPPVAAAADASAADAAKGVAANADAEDIAVLHVEFSDFYRAKWANLAQALTFAVGDRDLAVEVIDEAMARAYSRWQKLRDYDNPAAWVYRVGFNLAVSHHRRLARRLPWSRRDPELDTTDPMPVSDPAIRAALLELSPPFRSVVVCRLLLDWSVADTATALGIRPATVRTRLHRALQKLHVTLEHLR